MVLQAELQLFRDMKEMVCFNCTDEPSDFHGLC